MGVDYHQPPFSYYIPTKQMKRYTPLTLVAICIAICSNLLYADWTLTLKDQTQINFPNDPILSGNVYKVQVAKQWIEIPTDEIQSLRRTVKLKKEWLYKEADPTQNTSSTNSPGGQKAIVQINNQVSQGAGVIIHPDGYILTQYHVIKDNFDIHVRLKQVKDGKETFLTKKADIVSKSRLFDLALLKIELKEKIPFASFRKDNKINNGARVHTYSQLSQLNSPKVLGAIEKSSTYLSDHDGMLLQQIQLSLGSEHSGAPLFDEHGHLIGLLTRDVSSAKLKGAWYATPVSFIKLFLQNSDGFVHNPADHPPKYHTFE